MAENPDKKKILECKAADNEYLHKDFHGALCYAIKYLDDNFDEQATEEYLTQAAMSYFSPLIEKLKTDGLKALENHFRNIFTKEKGRFEIGYKDDKLILEILECPAIAHLKKRDLFFTDRYCLTTVVVNRTICKESGYNCSCEYEPGQGRCIQKFWKE